MRVAATGQATALMTLTDGAGSPGRDVMANKNLEWLPPSTAAARPVAPGKGIYFRPRDGHGRRVRVERVRLAERR